MMEKLKTRTGRGLNKKYKTRFAKELRKKYKTRFEKELRKKYKTRFEKDQSMVEFLNYLENEASIFELQELTDDIETSVKRGMHVEVQNIIAKFKDKKEHHPLSTKNDTDLSGETKGDIIKVYNILVEIENEIKRTNKRITSIESNIIKMEGESISKKYENLGAGIDHLSDLSTDIHKTLLKVLSISTKEDQSIGLPVPYIISLSLSTAVTIFCGTSLYINIFTAKTLFDPYLSLFWFLGGIGIGLMSLKGIFVWRDK